MNSEQLESLRKQILQDVVPLIIGNTENGADKFTLILRLIQSGQADASLYQRAYDSASGIEDTNERTEALMQLLDEVELQLASDLDELPSDGEPQQQAVESQEHPEQPNDQQEHQQG
jgi:hypothetical protein